MTDVPCWKPLLLVAAAAAVLWGSGGETTAAASPESAPQLADAAWSDDAAAFPRPVHAVSRPS